MRLFNPVSSWFVPKTFGYGWTAGTWEGWLVTAIIAVAIIVLTKLVLKHRV